MKFGRIPHFDERSRNFPVRSLIPATRRRSYTWRCGIALDQGDTPECTAFAGCHELAARPVVVKGLTNADAHKFYLRARQLDEIPGEFYDGSTSIGIMKTLVEAGYYGSYWWAFGEDDLAMTLGYKGPVLSGLNWYSDMMRVDSNGFVHVGGVVEGGHEICWIGYHDKEKVFRFQNSWGPDWSGMNGQALMSQKDVIRLLDEQGDAVIPQKRTIPK